MRRARRVLLVLLVLAILLLLLRGGTGPRVEAGSTLVMDLEGAYVEAVELPIVSRLLGLPRRTFAGLLSELRKAERDDRLATVVLRIRPLELGWGKAGEIRDAIAGLREAGRRTIAYLEVERFGANLEYFVATAADEIYLAPATRMPLVGLAAEYLFLGGLWGKLGIELEVEQVGKYKSAAESLSARTMSEANREMANSLLDSIEGQFVAAIAEGRRLSEGEVRAAIDRAPMTPEEMIEFGLADQVLYFDQMLEAQGDGPVVKSEDYARVDPASVGWNPVASFALIYGSGPVVSGRGSQSPAGGSVLASETVTRALADAVEDPRITAIIFRIDSPGGSPLASDVVWRATQLARKRGKPLVASFSDVAASGGYYVACGADAIVAPAGSLTGSIGVFLIRPVLAGLFEKLEIGVEALTRGKHADLLVASRPLSPGTRARLRVEVESIYDLFVDRVAAGRNLERERVNEVGRGRVWTGEQAAARGLVDEIGGLRAAVAHARSALGLAPDADVELIPFPKPKSLLAQLTELLQPSLTSLASRAVPLPRLLRRLQEWAVALPAGSPALIPPLWVEIR